MATAADLDTELAAAIIAQTSLAQRLISDYDDDTGEQIPHGVYRFRQRVDVLERVVLGSNDFNWACNVEVDGLLSMASPMHERDDIATIWADQTILVDPEFWRGLAAVYAVNGLTVPQTTEAIERIGRVLKFTVSVQVVLAE